MMSEAGPPSSPHVRPAFRGRLDPADGVGSTSPGECSDTVRVYLRVREDAIREISFECDGCEATAACAAKAVDLAAGRNLDDASEIAPDTVADAMGGLAPEYRHCARLACEALSAAIMDYVVRCVDRESSDEARA